LSHTFAVISIRVSYNKLILTKPSEFISLEVKNLELAMSKVLKKHVCRKKLIPENMP